MTPSQAHSIYRDLVLSRLPADMRVGFFLAFCRTFGVASIGGLLASTGQTIEHARRRAAGTRDTMYALFRHGFDEPEGAAAVQRLNRVHSRFAISNDDHRYVLGCLAVVPTRFAGRFGLRALTGEEITATHVFYRHLAGLMGIESVPDTYEGFEAWFDAYDRDHLVAHPAAGPLVSVSRRLLVHRVPSPLRPLAVRFIDAVLGERLRAAASIDRPGWPVRASLQGMVRLRRLLPPATTAAVISPR
ncbi:hypothetical protein HDA40_002112 [Hamadaea flava]|uniref:Oxygenase MpaB family protein n=1 Tax=Hamadaea flava TaxID=1742688 RepID=A0ABV8LLK3_9ACTN|nr:oxygenase MpaB family protein [Hamadaea flava]MCP2323605.1 hypothetical protein [Hamadaea flava]